MISGVVQYTLVLFHTWPKPTKRGRRENKRGGRRGEGEEESAIELAAHDGSQRRAEEGKERERERRPLEASGGPAAAGHLAIAKANEG